MTMQVHLRNLFKSTQAPFEGLFLWAHEMAYNTGNPLGSPAVKDVSDNSENFDRLLNDRSKATVPDRFGNPRTTYAEFERLAKSNTAIDAAARSEAARDQAEEAAELAAGYNNLQTYISFDSPSGKRMVDDVSQPWGTFGRVSNDADPKKNGDYIMTSSGWVWSDVQPASAPRLAETEIDVQDLQETIYPATGSQNLVDFVDRYGFPFGFIGADEINLPNFQIVNTGGAGSRLVDEYGFVGWILEGDRASFGPLTLQSTSVEGLLVIDDLGFVGRDLLENESNKVDTVESWASTSPQVVSIETPTVNGLNVTIPTFTMRSSAGDVTIPGQVVTLLAPPIDSVVGLPITVRYDTDARAGYNANDYLPNKYPSNVVVTRTSDSAVLVEGIDYRVLPLGKILGLINKASFSATVSYSAPKERYDLIHLNPITGAISVTQGVNRAVDPEEWMPDVPLGSIPLFSVLVHASPVQMEFVPMWMWRNGVRRGHEREDLEVHMHNLRCTSRIRRKLQAGQAIKLIGYGDSITAQGGGAPYNVPNTFRRDVPSHYLRNPQDTRDTWPLFDHGDEIGQGHVHLGWNWYLKSALEERYGVMVEYLNYGMSGTTAANYDGGASGSSRYGGLYAPRLNAMLSSNPDLVVLCFGMNDMPGSTTYMQDMHDIIVESRAAGADVVVMGIPRICSVGGKTTEAIWKRFNEQAWLAAQKAGAAFISTVYSEDAEGGAGYSGIAGPGMCATNNLNHPGPRQNQYNGHRLVFPFI
jgi:lysophospholipase L1-like esterase